jgi:hypothetical protein
MIRGVRLHDWLVLLVFVLAGSADGAFAHQPEVVSPAEPMAVAPKAEGAPLSVPLPSMAEVRYLAPADLPKMPAPPRRYIPPPGFAEHHWGDRRVAFARLPDAPLAVRAAWALGKERPHEFICSGAGRVPGDPLIAKCSLAELIRDSRPTLEGGGYHVLSEYAIERQGFKFWDTGVLLYPVVYQFCANWDSRKREVPKDFDSLNRFCGMRMLFDTEARSQLAGLPDDHVTRYELVLAELIAHYGKPAGFMWRGRVTLEPLDQATEPVPRSERRFSTWRWCPARDHGLQPSCDASIILSIDPDAGRGIVLFSTPALWQYAYARETGDAQPDQLFTLLHALQPKQRELFRQKKAAAREAAEQKAGRNEAAQENAAKK